MYESSNKSHRNLTAGFNPVSPTHLTKEYLSIPVTVPTEPDTIHLSLMFPEKHQGNLLSIFHKAKAKMGGSEEYYLTSEMH